MRASVDSSRRQYRCRVGHRLTGERIDSSNWARIKLTGKRERERLCFEIVFKVFVNFLTSSNQPTSRATYRTDRASTSMPPSARRWPLMRWSEVVVEVYILQLHHHHHPPPLPPPPQSITTSHHHRPWTCTVPLTGSRRQTFPGTLCPTFTPPPLLPPPQRIL